MQEPIELPATVPSVTLYAVVVPTLAAVYLGPMDEVVLNTEAAMYSPETLPVERVSGFLGGVLPLDSEGGRIAIPGGYTVIYGHSEEAVRQWACEHAFTLQEHIQDGPDLDGQYAAAFGRVSGQLGVAQEDMDMATALYVDALAGHPYFS